MHQTQSGAAFLFCQLAEKRYVTFVENCVNLGLPRQVAKLVRWWWRRRRRRRRWWWWW